MLLKTFGIFGGTVQHVLVCMSPLHFSVGHMYITLLAYEDLLVRMNLTRRLYEFNSQIRA